MIDRWIGRQIDRRVDRQIDRQIQIYMCMQIFIYVCQQSKRQTMCLPYPTVYHVSQCMSFHETICKLVIIRRVHRLSFLLHIYCAYLTSVGFQHSLGQESLYRERQRLIDLDMYVSNQKGRQCALPAKLQVICPSA